MEPTDNRQTAILPSGLDSPTDPLICGLLAAEPMTSPALAARLAIPARTVRHRLMRLRDAGAVTVGEDGIYRVGPFAGRPLPAVAAPGTNLSEASAAPAISGSAAWIVALGTLAALCVGAAIWAASRAASSRPAAPTAGPASYVWPYGMGWPGPGGF